MADTEQKQFVNMNKSGSHDSLSYNEWTIIDEASNGKAQEINVIRRNNEGSTDSNDSDDSNDVDARYDRRKRIQVFPEPRDSVSIEDKDEEFIEKQIEESDDISVITESEAEQSIVNKRFGELDRCESLLSGMFKKYEKPSDKTALQVGTVLNVVIACSLAAIIGLGAGRILSMDDKCPISSGIDFSTIRSENNMLIGQLKELSEVKDVLDQIKASIPQMKASKQKSCKGQMKSTSKKLKHFRDPIKISDTYSFDPDTTILEQLQISFNTLCSVIDEIYNTEKPFKADMLKTQNVIMDLITFKKLVNNVVKELHDVKKPMEIRFLQETESKIENICQSLLSDLSDVVHRLTIKIHHKLSKVRHKLNKRLCFLRNKESDDNKFLKSLIENNAFLESCNKILNVTLKSRDESADIKKLKNKKDRNILQKFAKIDEGSSNEFTAKFENSSDDDSSIPDLTYNRHDDFWKKRQTINRDDDQQQIKSDEAASHKINSQSGQSSMSVKSTGRCLKNVTMNALLPINTCPLPQISRSRAELIYTKSKEVKVPILNSTPLIASKATHVSVQSNKNSTEVKDASKKWAIDDIQAEYWIGSKADANVESISTETRHDVTPANSNVNVQGVKRSKEQRSEKVIQQPLTYFYAVTQRNDAPEAIALEQDTENIQRSNDFSESTMLSKGQKDCKREKKCPIVYDSSVKMNKKRSIDSSYNGKRDGNGISFEKGTKKKASKQRDKEIGNIDRVNSELKSPSCKFMPSEMKEKKYKKIKSQQKLNGEWQLQRSRARKELREREHESEWYFDRADSRRNARKDVNVDTRFYTSEGCPLFVDEDTYNEELYDYWLERKNTNEQKHSSNRAGYVAKKFMKMPHRKNIFQMRRR